MVTFVDRSKVKQARPRLLLPHGGVRAEGQTQRGLVALRLLPAAMPEAVAPAHLQMELA